MNNVVAQELTEKQKQFLHYVFVTAVEGGIGYWSIAEEYHWGLDGSEVSAPSYRIDDIDGFYAILSPQDDEWGLGIDHEVYVAETGALQQITPTQSLRVDINVVQRGVKLLAEKVVSGEFANPYLKQFVVQWLTSKEELTDEDGDSDSDGCDMAIQLGLFGEVVYG